MTDNNGNRDNQQRDQDTRDQDTRGQDQNAKRSGQETLGKRGQKVDKKEEERYRSNEEKKGRGRHGGNR